MFLFISRVFTLAAILTPLLLAREMFFPFISAKSIFFKVSIELGLLALLVHIAFSVDRKKLLQAIWERLKHPMVISAALFALAFLVTALVGINPEQSLWSNFERGEGAFAVLHYFLFFILLILVFPKPAQLRWPLLTHVGVSVLVSLYALLQLLYSAVWSPTPNWVIAAGARVSGTLGNPSYLAAYLLFTLAIIVYLFLQYKNAWLRWILGAVFLFEGFILLKTGTRGAFLGLIAAGLAILVANFFISKRQLVKQLLLVAVVVPILVMVFFFQFPHAPIWSQIPVLDRLINFNSAITDIQPRLWTWESGLAGTLERPLLGWGAENFAYPFDRYYNPNHYGIESFFDRTHNIFLEYTITGGLLLLLPWLAIFFFYYRELSRQTKNFWWTVLLGVPIAYLIQGFFLFDVLPIYLALFLFLALFIITTQEEKAPAIANSRSSIDGISLLVAGAGIAVVALGIYHAAYRVYEKNQLLATSLISDQQTLNIQFASQQHLDAFLGGLKLTHENYKTAYAYESVVGQEETVGSLMKFTVAGLEKVIQTPQIARLPAVRAQFGELVATANKWFDENPKMHLNLKNAFLNAAVNIQYAMLPTEDGSAMEIVSQEHLERGVTMLEEAVKEAPTRIEFIRILLRVAQMTGDEEAYENWLSRAKHLRADIPWE